MADLFHSHKDPTFDYSIYELVDTRQGKAKASSLWKTCSVFGSQPPYSPNHSTTQMPVAVYNAVVSRDQKALFMDSGWQKECKYRCIV